MLNTSNILTQSSNRGIFRIKLNEPDTYNALSFKTISFLIGKLIGNKVEDWIPEKYHHYIFQARKFMKKRGMLSVALGRFAGPLRCTVPFIAGSLGMKSKYFFPIEVLASPAWASLYVLTGYFLGVVFVEYFTYVLIAIIIIASLYTFYKDPLKSRN